MVSCILDLHTRLPSLFSLVLIFHHVHLCLSQQIFIDTVPSYSSLSACAINPVSSIVRDMVSGCGDKGHTTSYACFCYASSTAFAHIISTAVVKNCTQTTPGPQAQASSAVQVFSSYCQLGSQQGYPSASATSTSVSNQPNQGGGGGLSTTAQICLGVIIPLTCAGVPVLLFFLKRRKKKKNANADKSQATEPVEMPHTRSQPVRWWSHNTSTVSAVPEKQPVMHELPTTDA